MVGSLSSCSFLCLSSSSGSSCFKSSVLASLRAVFSCVSLRTSCRASASALFASLACPARLLWFLSLHANVQALLEATELSGSCSEKYILSESMAASQWRAAGKQITEVVAPLRMAIRTPASYTKRSWSTLNLYVSGAALPERQIYRQLKQAEEQGWWLTEDGIQASVLSNGSSLLGAQTG